MKIAFIGSVEFSFHTLKHLLTIPEVEIVGVVTRKSSSFNSDFCSLESLASAAGVPCFIAEANEQSQMAEWLSCLAPDVIYCFGWSYLLKKEILSLANLGVVGYHPAALPFNRGRHPIIWALCLGLKETGSTFFFMDEGADSGDVLDQKIVKIDSCDDAKSLYDKLTGVAISQISSFTYKLSQNNFKRYPQDHSKANYWRKRNKDDGLIDWRMSALCIYNLVRALTKPYIGAHCEYLGTDRKVWKIDFSPIDCQYENYEPGKVIKIKEGMITVKCGEGAVVLVEHEINPLPKEGEYL